MDAIRLRTAAGDAARSAQSVLRQAAADPDTAVAQLKQVTGAPFWIGPDRTPYSLRAEARNQILWAVAFMDAARQLEGQDGAA